MNADADTATDPVAPPTRPYAAFEPGPVKKAVLVTGGSVMFCVTALAVIRGGLSLAPVEFGALSFWVRLHILTVLPALPLGAWLFFAPKGTRLHRRLGQLWCLLMFVTAISTIFIREINEGSLSWIHLFTALTLFGVPSAIWLAWQKNIKQHVSTLTGLYIGALLIAGGFAFLPGRIMWTLAFG